MLCTPVKKDIFKNECLKTTLFIKHTPNHSTQWRAYMQGITVIIGMDLAPNFTQKA